MVRVQTCENVQKPQPHGVAYILLSYIIFIIYNHRNDSKDFSFQISDFTCFQVLLRCYVHIVFTKPAGILNERAIFYLGALEKS